MEVKHLIVLLELCCLSSAGGRCSKLPPKGLPRPTERFPVPRPELSGASLTGPGKMATELLEIMRNELVEDERKEEKFFGTEVDEETIKKAEQVADKDLLNGLNRILKNNETLQDVIRTENIYQIP